MGHMDRLVLDRGPYSGCPDGGSLAACCQAGTTATEEETKEPNVNVVFFGPCGGGKSTIAGRLVADCGAIDEQSLRRIAAEARERGQDDRRYAWILDKLRSERERGGTIFTALWRLTSAGSRLLVIDAPGHSDYAKDTVTAMSQADVAVLVVAAVQEDNDDEGRAREGRIRTHTLLAYTLGVRRLVVVVNKMDSEAVSYSQELFEHASSVVREDLQSVGFETGSVLFVPASGLSGDNVARRSEQTPWYSGPTLLEALHRAAAPEQFQPERPLRIPLREVYQIGGTEGAVVVGRVETGTLTPGMRLSLMPGNVTAEVLSVEMHQKKLDKAISGDCVNIHLSASMKEVRRGMVASALNDHPARECSSFLAQVIVLSPPRAGELKDGCVLTVDCHTAQVPCVFEEFLSRADRRTGKVLEIKPVSLQEGDAAVVRLRPQAPICVEPFSEYPPLGRFAVRDQKNIVGIGVVQDVTQAVSPAVRPALSTPHLPSRIKSTGKEHRHLRSSEGHSSSKTKARERDLGHGLGHGMLATSAESAAVAKPKVHHAGSLRLAGAKAKVAHREVDDTDPDEQSPKMAAQKPYPLRMGAGPSPFAAFGAVRSRQQEEKTVPRDEDAWQSRAGPLKREGLLDRRTRKESDASDG
eukprot:TRINITY_DN90416_c0_g1_i1.p1 TRINITY_DN90416_c0_g1~~TRINITY_DN90416_c0_g1_i1.p1  ORF type:complete len:639 (+),score=110.53 TRINITY_DN90416_c0_g1_i1:373-2289(+)